MLPSMDLLIFPIEYGSSSYVRDIDAVKVAGGHCQYVCPLLWRKERILLHQKHESDTRQEAPIQFLQNFLVEQRHLHFRLVHKQRVSLENLIVQTDASRLFDMFDSVDLLLQRRSLLLVGETFAVAGHVEG